VKKLRVDFYARGLGVRIIEQVVASASLLTEDILKSRTQRRCFIPSTSKRKERLLKPKVVAVEA
jgi:hypothetical protein